MGRVGRVLCALGSLNQYTSLPSISLCTHNLPVHSVHRSWVLLFARISRWQLWEDWFLSLPRPALPFPQIVLLHSVPRVQLSLITKTKLRGFSPQANLPTLADRGCRVDSATDPHGRNLGFLDPEPLLFHSSSSSIILTRLSGPTSSLKMW
jgi:hypothetical protein